MTEKIRIIGKRIFLITVDKFILQIYVDHVSPRNKQPNAAHHAPAGPIAAT